MPVPKKSAVAQALPFATRAADRMGNDVIKPSPACLLFTTVLAGLSPFTACGSAAAQSYPSSTVKIVVPNPAGGTADALPRIIADALSGVWKQAVVVENRPGAAGNVGAESFSRAPADGYSLLASPPTTLAINQSLYKKLNYDPTKFKPITILASSPNVLIVNPKLGVSTVRELIEKAKARSRCHCLWVAGHWRHIASDNGPVRDDGGCEVQSCALSRHGPCHERPGRRPHPLHV
jgi:hypothetical protein